MYQQKQHVSESAGDEILTLSLNLYRFLQGRPLSINFPGKMLHASNLPPCS